MPRRAGSGGRLCVTASLVGCAVAAAARTAILAAAAVALGENRPYAQPAGVSTAAVTSDSDAADAAAALERLSRARFREVGGDEKKLMHAAPRGALLWVVAHSPGAPPPQPPQYAAEFVPPQPSRPT